MMYTRAPCTRQALYKRISRWKNNLSSSNKLIIQAIDVARGVVSTNHAPLVSTNHAFPAPEAATTPNTSRTKVIITPATTKALDGIDSWLNRNKTESSMCLRKKRTATQVCRDNFSTKARKIYYGARHSDAFKLASSELLAHTLDSKTYGKRGHGARAIAAKYNESTLNSPSDRKLLATSLQLSVTDNRAGKSPVARGRPEKIPSILCAALAKQSVMLKVAGEGEASSAKMQSLIEGLRTGTPWDEVFTTRGCWRKTLKNPPEVMNTAKAKNNENCRVEWLTFRNIKDWTARAKSFLIDIGMAKDEPGTIREFIFFRCFTYIPY